jgi:hypothetical protein
MRRSAREARKAVRGVWARGRRWAVVLSILLVVVVAWVVLVVIVIVVVLVEVVVVVEEETRVWRKKPAPRTPV